MPKRSREVSLLEPLFPKLLSFPNTLFLIDYFLKKDSSLTDKECEKLKSKILANESLLPKLEIIALPYLQSYKTNDHFHGLKTINLLCDTLAAPTPTQQLSLTRKLLVQDNVSNYVLTFEKELKDQKVFYQQQGQLKFANFLLEIVNMRIANNTNYNHRRSDYITDKSKAWLETGSGEQCVNTIVNKINLKNQNPLSYLSNRHAGYLTYINPSLHLRPTKYRDVKQADIAACSAQYSADFNDLLHKQQNTNSSSSSTTSQQAILSDAMPSAAPQFQQNNYPTFNDFISQQNLNSSSSSTAQPLPANIIDVTAEEEQYLLENFAQFEDELVFDFSSQNASVAEQNNSYDAKDVTAAQSLLNLSKPPAIIGDPAGSTLAKQDIKIEK